MKIINRENNETMNELILFLTQKEGLELSNELQKLIKHPNNYTVIVKGEDLNGNMTKEIVVRIYNENNMNTFDERIQKLILNDK